MIVFAAHGQIVNPIGFLETDGFGEFEITSDGSTVYALGFDEITAFNRDSETGQLSEAGSTPFSRRGGNMQLTPDDQFIYAGGPGATGLTLYERDPVSSQLSLIDDDVLSFNPDPLIPEWTIQYVSLSHDGNTIYALLFPTNPGIDNNPVRLQIYSRDNNDGSAALIQSIVFDQGPLELRLPSELFTTPDNRHLYLQQVFSTFVYSIASDGRLTFLRESPPVIRDGVLLPVDISADSEQIFIFEPGPPTSPPSPSNIVVLNREPASGNLSIGPSMTLSPAFFGPNVTDQSANALLANQQFLVLSNSARSGGSIFRLIGENSQPLLLPESQFPPNPLVNNTPFTMIASPDERHLYYAHSNGIAIFEFNGELPPEATPVPSLRGYAVGILVLLLMFIGIYRNRRRANINT